MNQLNEKFEHCLSDGQIEQIRKMKQVLKLEMYQHHHVSLIWTRFNEHSS
ncbi:hypothetical protein [Paenibacillus lutimineralis]